ncbi:MAG: TRAP transporter substrate-binding protein [Deltaproteobacteria bacterium]|nr:TRAP transporter substrate-binding protein [Deltaproteobacteria bacterium]
MKRVVTSAILPLALLLLTLPPVGVGFAAEKPLRLSYSIFFPPAHGQAATAMAWAKEVEKRTGGRVVIDTFPGGTLTPAADCYDGVVNGISDIGMSCFAYTRGRFPVMEALDLPMGYPSGHAATQTANDFFRVMNPKELADVKVLYLHAHGPGLLHTKTPVSRMEDLKGMKIRSTGFSAKVTQALGAIPVAMPQGETYEALQKGVVNGTFTPIETLKGWKQAEVIKATTDCPAIGYTTAMFVVMNRDKWNALPEDIKKVFDDLNREWIGKHGTEWDRLDEEGKSYSLGQENKIIPLTAAESQRWVAAVKPIIDEYRQQANAKGLPGDQAVAELQKLLHKPTKP